MIGKDGPNFRFEETHTIVIAFFTSRNTGPYAELEDRIGRVSRMIVDYFDGGGAVN